MSIHEIFVSPSKTKRNPTTHPEVYLCTVELSEITATRTNILKVHKIKGNI